MSKLPSTNLSLYTAPRVADETFTDSHIVFIDSRFKKSGTNVNFVVDFNATNHGAYHHVSSVEMLGMSINAKTVFDAGEHYIGLKINELESRVQSNNPNLNDYFCIVYLHPEKLKDEYAHTRAVKGVDFDRKYKLFNPVTTLSKLHVSIHNGFTGEVFDDDGHTTFLFKIRTEKTNH